MAEKKNRLGKGLANIYGDDIYNIIDDLEKNGPTDSVLVDQIRPNPYQPRKTFDEDSLNELAESIKTHGVITPVLLKLAVNGYELVAGERRVRAAKLAGLEYIPAIVAEFDDKQMMEISLLENIQREDLNAIEIAKGYSRLIESFGYTQQELAERVNKERTDVTNHLRLLKLPTSVQDLVMTGKLNMGHVRPLVTIEDKKQLEALAIKIAEEGLSVRQAEALAKAPQPTGNKVKEDLTKYRTAEELLTDKLQTSVHIDDKKIVIKYRGVSDLNRLLEILDCLQK